jgi:hypothetical protein
MAWQRASVWFDSPEADQYRKDNAADQRRQYAAREAMLRERFAQWFAGAYRADPNGAEYLAEVARGWSNHAESNGLRRWGRDRSWGQWVEKQCWSAGYSSAREPVTGLRVVNGVTCPEPSRAGTVSTRVRSFIASVWQRDDAGLVPLADIADQMSFDDAAMGPIDMDISPRMVALTIDAMGIPRVRRACGWCARLAARPDTEI